MSDRNLSPQAMFVALAESHRPRHHFDSQSFDLWKQAALPEVLATLGDPPAICPPRPERIDAWTHDGLRKETWLLDVSAHASVELQINYPSVAHRSAPGPAILCCHGHDAEGKDAIMGNRPEVPAAMCFGHRLAKQGFVTFGIDFFGRNTRHDGPADEPHAPGHRDWCNLYYLHATMLGMTNLGIQLAQTCRVVDFVASLPEVAADQLGVMGWSGGGTMALWLSLVDERFKATEIISYSGLWADFAFRDLNYCGWQMTPGLFKLVDLPELQGLLAPRPLLVDIGQEDLCFKVEPSLQCHQRLQRIYQAAGAESQLHLNLNPGGHGSWDLPTTTTFFKTYLLPREALP